jgi:hypothetical protein
LKPSERPSTQAEEAGGALYVEKFDLPPQSLLREDDFEVYFRQTTYRNKVTKAVNKFLSRAKWIPATKKFDIYQNALKRYFDLKKQNIEDQKAQVDQVVQKALRHNVVTADF